MKNIKREEYTMSYLVRLEIERIREQSERERERDYKRENRASIDTHIENSERETVSLDDDAAALGSS